MSEADDGGMLAVAPGGVKSAVGAPARLRRFSPVLISARMKAAWSPADGPDAALQQRVPVGTEVFGDGSTERSRKGLWTPSEGPVRHDPGGPGGEPNGRTIPIPGRTALNER